MMVTISDVEFANKRIRTLNIDKILLKLRSGQILLSFVDKLFSREKLELVHRVRLQDYRDNLNEMIKLSKEMNIKVVLLTGLLEVNRLMSCGGRISPRYIILL